VVFLNISLDLPLLLVEEIQTGLQFLRSGRSAQRQLKCPLHLRLGIIPGLALQAGGEMLGLVLNEVTV
jgi:hypothetical protein